MPTLSEMQQNTEVIKKKAKRTAKTVVSSIAFRIIITLAIVMGIVFVIIFVKQKKEIYESVSMYYSQVGALASEILSRTMADSEEELQKVIDDDFLIQLQSFCKEYNINDIFIAKSNPPYEWSKEIVYVSPRHRIIRDDSNIEHRVVMTLGEEESEVFAGKRSFLYTQYEMNNTLYSSYISGIYDTNGHCFAVVGVDFLTMEIQEIINSHISQLTWYLLLSGFLSCLVIILGLHFLVIRPIKTINCHMDDFVSGDKLNPKRLKIRGYSEMAQMASSYNAMVDDITQYIQTLKMITVAGEIQKGLLPKEHYEDQNVIIEAFLQPAKDVGGDFYDYYTIDDSHMCFVIADVSGKGMNAAIFMANALNAIKYNAKLYAVPSEVLRNANNDLCVRNSESLFVTVFIAVYDCKHHTLTYSNGGHNPPYLLRNSHVMELNQANGLLLGLFPNETYQDYTMQILPQDVLFLYTDGLSEAVSTDKTFFGENRICNVLQQINLNELTQTIPHLMKSHVDDFVGDAEPHDDLTMLSVIFHGRQYLKMDAKLHNMPKAKRFVLENPWLSEKECRKIYLAIEELLVNIICYGFSEDQNGIIEIFMTAMPNEIEFIIKDNGIPYNPLTEVITPEEYDPDTQCGGLGKLIAFSIMKPEYQYQNGMNILRLTKELQT